ncbi:MAG: hypothetical protein WAM66_02245 [Acidobacteriaceae bacterium]
MASSSTRNASIAGGLLPRSGMERVSEEHKLTAQEAAALRTYRTGRAGNHLPEAAAVGRAFATRGFSTQGRANSQRFGSSTGNPKYTTDFPDSTEGTALISPPDLGTVSPLEWSPSLSFALPDFSTMQFLSPTLHTGGRSGMRSKAGHAAAFSRESNLSGRSLLPPPSTSVSGQPNSALPDSLLSPGDALLSHDLSPSTPDQQ